MIGNTVAMETVKSPKSTICYLYIYVSLVYLLPHKLCSVPFINPFQDDKILGLPKLKAFVDEFVEDNSNVTQNIKVVFPRIKKNIVGKEENAGYQHFLLFPQCFQRVFSLHCAGQKLSLCGKG